MCWIRACFDDYKATTGRSVTTGDKGSVATAGVGTVVLNVIVQGKTRKIKLERVLHVPIIADVPILSSPDKNISAHVQL